MVTASQCVFSTELLNYCSPSALGYSVAVSLGLGISDRQSSMQPWAGGSHVSWVSPLHYRGQECWTFFFFFFLKTCKHELPAAVSLQVGFACNKNEGNRTSGPQSPFLDLLGLCTNLLQAAKANQGSRVWLCASANRSCFIFPSSRRPNMDAILIEASWRVPKP